MRRRIRFAALITAVALPLSVAACSSNAKPAGSSGNNNQVIKVGFITKFPVDFYDIMVDAVKKYDKDHADVEVVFGQGKSGTDDEGVINTSENMIAQNVKAMAGTPTSPA